MNRFTLCLVKCCLVDMHAFLLFAVSQAVQQTKLLLSWLHMTQPAPWYVSIWKLSHCIVHVCCKHGASSIIALQVSNSSTGETSKKGLYALAALLRNNVDARRQFYQNNGIQQLTDMLSNPDQPQPVKLKIVNLITDLSELDLQMQVSTLLC